MEQFEPIDIDFVINSDEVKASTDKVKQDLKSVGQTAEETSAKVNAQLKQTFDGDIPQGIANTNKALTEQSAIIQRTRPQYNGLGNSINQISREMSAFTVSAQTGFLAISNNIPILADEINRLRQQNAALTDSGEKAVPVWKQVVSNLFSWQTALSVGITLLTVYGKEFVDYVATLFKGREEIDALKDSQQALNKAFESNSYRKAIADIIELESYIELAKKGFIDKADAVERYNEVLGDAAGEVEDLETAEQNLINKAPAYVEAMLYKAAAAEATAEAATKLAESARLEQEIEDKRIEIENRKVQQVQGGYNPTSPGSVNVSSLKQQSDLNKLNEELNELLQERDKLQQAAAKTVSSLYQQAAEAAKAAGLDIFGDNDGTSDENKKNAKVSAYKSLLKQLEDLDAEYSRKQLTKDGEELQALRDKFDKIRNLVTAFNADPKNKANLIDLTGLDDLQVQAEASLVYRQNTDALKDQVAEEKRLYNEFEAYKKQFGEAAAKEEYANKIQEGQNYYAYLKQLQKDNATAFTAVDNGTATGAQIERVNFINDALEKERQRQKQLFDAQLADLLNYNQKRKLLIEQYNADYAKLIREGQTEAAAELTVRHNDELNALDDANVKKLQSYQELFNGIVDLTRKEARIVIANAKEMLKVQNLSGEMKARILQRILELEKALNGQSLDDIYQLAQGVGALGASFVDLGNSLGNENLLNAGGMLSGLASGIENVLVSFDKEASNMDKITAGLNGMVNLIGMVANASARRREAEEAYYMSVIGFQNDYNLALNEQIRLQSILEENVFIKDYEGRVKDALDGIRDANAEYQDAIDNLIKEGQVKVGQRDAVDWNSIGAGVGSGAAVGAAVGSFIPVIGNIIGGAIGGLVGGIVGLFGGKKKKDRYGDILEEYPELIQQSEDGMQRLNTALAQSLIENELVKGETKEILENILAWEEALEAARAQLKEVITDLTGGLATDLRTVLVDAFEAGEDAALKMEDTVEKVLENIVSNLVFNQVFAQAFDDLEKQMADSFDVGGDGSWIDDFGDFFNQASALTDDFNAAMEAAQQEAENFGFDIFKGDDTEARQGLSGAIRRELTEETGSELTGLFRNQYDVTRRMQEQAEAYYEREKACQSAVLELITIVTNIEVNTAETVEQLRQAVSTLNKISTNTEQHYLLELGS